LATVIVPSSLVRIFAAETLVVERVKKASVKIKNEVKIFRILNYIYVCFRYAIVFLSGLILLI
jgi:hypothetical protein